MAIIKSSDSNNHLYVDSTSKAMRAIEYLGVNGLGIYRTIGNSPYYTGMVSTFRSIGSAAVPQNLFCMENFAGPNVIVTIRGIYFRCDVTPALTTVACQCDLMRTANPSTTGFILTKVPLMTLEPSSPGVLVKGGATADANNGSVTVTSQPGAYINRVFIPRLHTQAGQTIKTLARTDPLFSIGTNIQKIPFVLKSGQGIVVQITGTAASNAATNHYIVDVIWDEYYKESIYESD